jgi:hypothetical protein
MHLDQLFETYLAHLTRKGRDGKTTATPICCLRTILLSMARHR